MDEALSAWLKLSVAAATAFRNYPLTSTYSSPNFLGQMIHHGGEVGRWYCVENRLDGPAHHSKADWEAAINRALALCAAALVVRTVPQNDPKCRRNRKWWLDDYAGKHGPGTG